METLKLNVINKVNSITTLNTVVNLRSIVAKCNDRSIQKALNGVHYKDIHVYEHGITIYENKYTTDLEDLVFISPKEAEGFFNIYSPAEVKYFIHCSDLTSEQIYDNKINIEKVYRSFWWEEVSYNECDYYSMVIIDKKFKIFFPVWEEIQNKLRDEERDEEESSVLRYYSTHFEEIETRLLSR